jgi:hypothetical protein
MHDNRGGLGTRPNQGLTHLVAVQQAKTPTQLLTVGITQQHGLVRIKLALYCRHTHEQQGRTSIHKGLTGALIQAKFSLWHQHVGQPAASVAKGFGMRMKNSAATFSLEQSG